jgi:hypothetical protein
MNGQPVPTLGHAVYKASVVSSSVWCVHCGKNGDVQTGLHNLFQLNDAKTSVDRQLCDSIRQADWTGDIAVKDDLRQECLEHVTPQSKPPLAQRGPPCLRRLPRIQFMHVKSKSVQFF